MREPTDPLSLIGILGPPRSGTTLIANAMISHSEATGIIEPYQVRRDSNYLTTDPAFLLRDFKINTAAARHVFVKETTTRAPNIAATIELLRKAREKEIYTGLVVILRNPLDAYLSQVEASRTMWKHKLMTEVSEATFDAFALCVLRGVRQICQHARAQHFRLTSYERFCTEPGTELARLMALVPLRIEVSQLNFVPPDKIPTGGDPKTKAKAGGVVQSSHDAAAAVLRDKFAGRPMLRFFGEMETLIRNRIRVVPDGVAMDELTTLCLKQWEK